MHWSNPRVNNYIYYISSWIATKVLIGHFLFTNISAYFSKTLQNVDLPTFQNQVLRILSSNIEGFVYLSTFWHVNHYEIWCPFLVDKALGDAAEEEMQYTRDQGGDDLPQLDGYTATHDGSVVTLTKKGEGEM